MYINNNLYNANNEETEFWYMCVYVRAKIIARKIFDIFV